MNFDSLYNFQSYCNYKDLEGVYCESCKKWLVYGEKTEGKKFYIVSSKLKPCSDCVKVRNGHYPYLSNFRMFKKAFNKSTNKALKQEILNLFRTNGQERFIKKYISTQSIWGCEIDYCDKKIQHMIVKKNKFKYIPDVILEHDFEKTTIGNVYTLGDYSDINRELIEAIQQITKIQHERPVMKYIITKQFGTTEQKLKIYNHYKQFSNLLEDVSYETFWDEFGLHYIMGIEDSIYNNTVIDIIENQDMFMMLHLYDFEIHWSERAQHYFKRRFYKPKRFNVHNLGYY